MKVSILIVNYNGKKIIDSLLSSIKKSSFKSYEIIVVDNNSDDGSQDFIRKNYKKVKLVQNKENLGYSGINSGLKHCKGDYILFLNNDMELDRNCISKMVQTIESDENTAMVAPGLINFYDKKLRSGGTWVSRAFYNGHNRYQSKVKEIPYLGVGLIKKDFVKKFGYLFDPDYFIYAEDLDLGLRIRLNNKKILFQPNAIMHHMHSATMKNANTYRKTFLLERNLLVTYFKILSLKNILLLMPYVLLIRLIAIIKDLVTLNPINILARLKAVFWIIFNFNSILNKRSKTQKSRKVKDAYILKVFSEKYLFKKRIIV